MELADLERQPQILTEKEISNSRRLREVIRFLTKCVAYVAWKTFCLRHNRNEAAELIAPLLLFCHLKYDRLPRSKSRGCSSQRGAKFSLSGLRQERG